MRSTRRVRVQIPNFARVFCVILSEAKDLVRASARRVGTVRTSEAGEDERYLLLPFATAWKLERVERRG
jgi:hypothetical protein